ncbi:unnamed protein product [Urochloa decumbens]|uniref:F-box domain-containing protein n=1 Tax=Urochloa decumbens TaxID=240449 RepID=A0ABC9GA58_9POAL
MAPPSPHSRASVRPLPLDALYEVLLRVPAKDLCRLRAVCRPWRALLSDLNFIDAHAARHPKRLIVAAHHTDGLAAGHHLFGIMDLSGRVIKRVVRPGQEWVMTALLDVVCVLMTNDMSYLLFNLATGVVSALPHGLAEEHSRRARDISDYRHLVAVGKVASTGEYKVLRVLDKYFEQEQLCEVFTLDGSSHARWRGKKASPDSLHPHPWNRVTINGIVYFLSHEIVKDQGNLSLRIASFDLETEEWREILRAPLNVCYIPIGNLSMASLNGCLVVIHYIRHWPSMDLWFLKDFEKGLWAKQHSIPLKSGFLYEDIPVRPLLVLNDGRILYYEEQKLLRIYDPKTCTSTDVAEIGPYYEIGWYTGSLLSLPEGAGA